VIDLLLFGGVAFIWYWVGVESGRLKELEERDRQAAEAQWLMDVQMAQRGK
jgi:hypothetical protein